MKYVNRLTREVEQHMPEFGSYEEARDWFKEKFGGMFTGLKDVYDVDGEPCYEHHVVVDPQSYNEGRKDLFADIESGKVKVAKDGTPLVNMAEYDAMDYMMSYHPIQIMKSGGVHIVY